MGIKIFVKIVSYVVEDLLGGVPVHDDLEHRAEEPAVAVRLVLRARGHRVRNVAEYL